MINIPNNNYFVAITGSVLTLLLILSLTAGAGYAQSNDSDGDGVENVYDLCSNTKTQPVDTSGCSCEQQRNRGMEPLSSGCEGTDNTGQNNKNNTSNSSNTRSNNNFSLASSDTEDDGFWETTEVYADSAGMWADTAGVWADTVGGYVNQAMNTYKRYKSVEQALEQDNYMAAAKQLGGMLNMSKEYKKLKNAYGTYKDAQQAYKDFTKGNYEAVLGNEFVEEYAPSSIQDTAARVLEYKKDVEVAIQEVEDGEAMVESGNIIQGLDKFSSAGNRMIGEDELDLAKTFVYDPMGTATNCRDPEAAAEDAKDAYKKAKNIDSSSPSQKIQDSEDFAGKIENIANKCKKSEGNTDDMTTSPGSVDGNITVDKSATEHTKVDGSDTVAEPDPGDEHSGKHKHHDKLHVHNPDGDHEHHDTKHKSMSEKTGTADALKKTAEKEKTSIKENEEKVQEQQAQMGNVGSRSPAASAEERVQAQRNREMAMAQVIRNKFINQEKGGLVGYNMKLASEAPSRGIRQNLQAAVYSEFLTARRNVLELMILETRLRQEAREAVE